jgi:hypothetical protein
MLIAEHYLQLKNVGPPWIQHMRNKAINCGYWPDQVLGDNRHRFTASSQRVSAPNHTSVQLLRCSPSSQQQHSSDHYKCH